MIVRVRNICRVNYNILNRVSRETKAKLSTNSLKIFHLQTLRSTYSEHHYSAHSHRNNTDVSTNNASIFPAGLPIQIRNPDASESARRSIERWLQHSLYKSHIDYADSYYVTSTKTKVRNERKEKNRRNQPSPPSRSLVTNPYHKLA